MASGGLGHKPGAADMGREIPGPGLGILLAPGRTDPWRLARLINILLSQGALEFQHHKTRRPSQWGHS